VWWFTYGMIRRLFLSAMLVVTVGAVLTAVSGVASGAAHHKVVPVLGSKAFPGSTDAIGFGTAHPKHVFNGGDPSGDAVHLKWTGWGKPTTIAHGQTFGPTHKRRIEFRASDLGHCTANGPLAYRHLHARVALPHKPYGHWFRWAEAKNICHAQA
jgi:hypothetical protein